MKALSGTGPPDMLAKRNKNRGLESLPQIPADVLDYTHYLSGLVVNDRLP